MPLVEIVLTDDQAALASQAIHLALQNATEEQISEDAEDELKRLSVFLAMVAADPESFPVRREAAIPRSAPRLNSRKRRRYRVTMKGANPSA